MLRPATRPRRSGTRSRGGSSWSASRPTRDRAALLADRERLRQAEQLTADRRARLLDLQLDGIREAPVGVVVACDRRTPAAGVLGRATFADADLWSCACAVENMWLAARAAGLGLGWVTLFQPADLAGLLHLPDGVETLGWLCLGWPDERPPDPGPRTARLVAAAAAGRRGDQRALAVGRRAARRPPPTSRVPDQRAVVAGRDTGDDLLTVPGSLGVLDAAVNRVLALSPAPPAGGTLIIAAADHPVTRHGVSAFPPSVTADVLAATREGVSLGATTARQAGLRVAAVHARPAGPGRRPGRGRRDAPRRRRPPHRAGQRARTPPRRPGSDLPGRGRHRQHHRRGRAELRAARPLPRGRRRPRRQRRRTR